MARAEAERPAIADYYFAAKLSCRADRKEPMAAWLLVQHADHDVTFQRECLRLLEAAVRLGEASRQHLAFLTDRALVNQGKCQVYGTQFRVEGPHPIEDEADLGTRRLRMGLTAFEQYKREMLHANAQEQPDVEPLYRPLRQNRAQTG